MHTPSIRHVFTAAMCGFMFGVTFLLASSPARAQDEASQIERSFKTLSMEEETELRAVLAVPIKKDGFQAALSAQLEQKFQAALKLGDSQVVFETYKNAASYLPDAKYKSSYATLLIQNGEVEEGTRLRLEALKNAENPYIRISILSGLMQDSYLLNQDEQARVTGKELLGWLNGVNTQTSAQSLEILRSRAAYHHNLSLIEQRNGQYDKAVEQASLSEIQAYKAVNYLRSEPREFMRINTLQRLVSSLERKLQALIAANKLQDANQASANLLKLFQDMSLPRASQIAVFNGVASLRFAQRDFISSINLWDRSLEFGQKLNVLSTSEWITNLTRSKSHAMLGLHRYSAALAEFQKLDALAGDDDKLKARVRYPFDRAVVYLYNNKAREASPLLASESASLAKQYGATPSGKQHFFTAQASGLQGVALWRVGTPEFKAAAYPLLQAAVRDIMAPENVDYIENIGIRKELREMIFSAYIEAASVSNPTDALAALGIADWLRGGLVQEALGDAAVRAAASNTALSDLVRQDQDARNEIKGLRNYLSGEAGGAASPLPQVAAQMRERIALLDKTRADVQIKIKAAFPDYEKLVRPLPPATAEIQAKLKADEALVVLQPTDHATYVWVVNREGTGQFHRAPVDEATLKRLVTRLRSTLDVAGLPANRMPAFDSAAAFELYQKLLAPVQSGFAGKTSLIVAAGGALGQIPFGILQTQATSANPSTSSGRTVINNADAPWLIQQAAITHVPSVAAWLSMRSLPHKTAPEAMLAWGDPLFNVAQANTGTGKSSAGEVRKVNLTRANTAVDLEKEDPRSALKYADIPALPETRDELMAIAKTLGADAAKDLILGSQATRESVLEQNKNGNLAKRRVVAFATHGLMAGDLPNLTQPALAMAGTKDGTTNVLAPLLTLEDVLGLKLNADWVVLSACNTAAADGKAEEALSGLARGFFYAGSRSLLVTHWAVDSDSAVTLTTETFKNYQSKPTEAKAESLRQAMLTAMRDPKTSHPAYWAPYALVGDGAR